MQNETTEAFNFETALEELNQLVTKMEQGGLSLEESLQCFEKGIALTRRCQKALQEAEQKVQEVLLDSNGEISTTNFAQDDD